MNRFTKIFSLVFHRSPNPDEDVEIDGGHKENWVLIRGGEFTMGSAVGEAGRSDNETLHRVKVSEFSIGQYAVTFGEFECFIAESGYKTDAEKSGDPVNWRHGMLGSVRPASECNHPVIYVSWNDAVAYCQWMSAKTGKTYRLPTEAEREYACRAGSVTESYIWYRADTGTFNSFSFAPGLYDLRQNLNEWCSDWYGERYYDECEALGTLTNPVGPATGSDRVIRGGSWYDDAESCRSTFRYINTPDYRHDHVGFRLVFVP